MQLSDSHIREQALNPKQSFIVEAPAGSGKTDLLVKRFVALLTTAAEPESILAITFTRKAASEMKERINAMLRQKGLSHISENQLRIMTIDAFCKEIVMMAPLQHNLFGAEMLEDEAALEADLLEAFLEVIETNEPGAQDLIALFQYFDNQLSMTVALLLKLLKNREEWLSLILQAREKPMAGIHLLYEAATLKLKAQGCNWTAEQVQAIIPELFTQKFELRKRLDASWHDLRDRLLNEEGLLDLFVYIAHLPEENHNPDPILAVMLRVLPLAAAHLKVILAERGETNFHEIALTALTLLQDSEQDILRRLDVAIKHILVDEFQDTSNLQFQLLQLLTNDWRMGDGRTLFLVGDPKQSIYRFRNAEVGLFLEAKHQGIGALKLTALQLTQNFRTDAPLLKWINQNCQSFFPTVEDEHLGKVPYVPCHPREGGDPVADTEVSLKLYETDEEEAEAIVKQIAELQQTNPTAKTAILVRARSHYQTIIANLEAAGLSYSVADDKRWLNSVFLDDLLSLLYAICQPQDRLSWMALLHSPFCGWSLQRIYDYVKSGKPLWEGVPELVPFITGPEALLTPYEKLVRGLVCLGLAAPAQGSLLTACSDSPRPVGCETRDLLADSPTPKLLSSVDMKIVERVSRVLLHLDVLPEQALLREMLARFDFGEEKSDSAITLLTIHQAKGLEFDCVFLPALQKRVARDEAPLLYTETFYQNETFHFLLAERKSRGGETSSLYRYLDWLEAEKAKYESMRLLYVAMTRAKHQLFLSAVVEAEEGKETKVPKGSFLSLLEVI